MVLPTGTPPLLLGQSPLLDHKDQVQPIIEQIVRNLKYNSQDVYVQQFYIEPSSFPEFVDKLRESDYSTLRYMYDHVKGILQLSMPTPVHEVFIERLSDLLQGELSGLIRRPDGKFKCNPNTSKFLRRGQITTVPDLALRFQSLNPSTEWQDLFIVKVSHSQSLGDITQKVKKYWEELPHLVGILVVKFYESHKYAKPQYGYAEPVNMQYWYNLQKDDNIKYGPLRTADSVTWAGRFVVDMYLYEKDPKVVGKEGYARDLPMPVVLMWANSIPLKDKFNEVFNHVITRSILEMEKIMRSAPQTVANLEAESAAAQMAALEVATQDLIANHTGCPLQSGTHSRMPTTTLPTPHLHPQLIWHIDVFRITIKPPEVVVRQLGEGVLFTLKKKWFRFKEKMAHIPSMVDHTYPACGKLLKTPQGIMAHLSMSAICAWYRKGKRRELEADNLGPEQVVFDEVNLDENFYDQEDYDSDGSEDIFLNSLQEPFNNFLNDPAMQGNIQYNLNPDPEMQASSSCHPHSLHFNLDNNDDNDERVVEQNENAGKVIRVDLDAHNKWRESFHQLHQDDDEMDVDLPDNRWAPFSTELDWKFAHWALQEGVGQKSLDRLLAIPEALLPQGAHLTLGNIPSSIRHKPSQHACVLIGYLSVNKLVKKSLTTKEKISAASFTQ
ncbi:hypothetical protein SERLADRAFT_404854 [Serpula lacrymans var. lacrymans S7.9]|uniref:Uncharacterized protein n=1 Tax=Serpula lacrymans var. lacrymans (strain S7.9) TaxID=578457 RepID=F8NFN3_SERL9|nr:uncharacterized protein SERLADRAFT_404854 [Serpula lacrymans var. lacrymans S7.9]EGO30873.1 hypothetical protein SERLADRAFT_404854 [Serpula lacrymans var. lacrymans S7.9]